MIIFPNNDCCPCEISSNLSRCMNGDTVDKGCCPSNEDLIMWSTRPGHSILQQEVLMCSPGVTKQQEYTLSVADREPIQTLYEFDTTYWRVERVCDSGCIAYDCFLPLTNTEDPGSGMLTLCPGGEVPIPACGGQDSPCITNCNGVSTHCEAGQVDCERMVVTMTDIVADKLIGCCNPDNIPSSGCSCKSSWMTSYRKRMLLDNPLYKYAPELECYNGGKFLIGTGARMSDFWMCNAMFENWWKIKEYDAEPGKFVILPDGVATEDGNNFVNEELVPQRWIFACSACPLFGFDFQDANNHGSSFDIDQINDILCTADHPSMELQQVMTEMSSLGYLVAKDWREEQKQTYMELHERFPLAGYGVHAEKEISEMNLLGPFRKRFCRTVDVASRKPILDARLFEPSSRKLQSAYNIDYPGFALPNAPQDSVEFNNWNGLTREEQLEEIEDYKFWADRQWVYFRAIPKGWTWTGWGQTDDNILDGVSRLDPACTASWQNLPQNEIKTCNASASACGPIEDPWPTCPSCDDCDCTAIQQGCPAALCSPITFHSYCDGVHIISTQYATANKCDVVASPCVEGQTETIASFTSTLWQSNTFLVSARKFHDWEFNQEGLGCRSVDTIGVFHSWPSVKCAHQVPKNPMCDPHFSASLPCPFTLASDQQYLNFPAALSGFCVQTGAVKCGPDPLNVISCGLKQRICHKNTIMPARGDCPPSNGDAAVRDDELGFNVECN